MKQIGKSKDHGTITSFRPDETIFTGGIEWNFPDGHTLTTVSPIDYVMRMEPDGSAAVSA